MVISIKSLIPNQVISARQTRSGRIDNLALKENCIAMAFTWTMQCKMHCNYRATALLKERNFLMQQSSSYVPEVLIYSKGESYFTSALFTVWVKTQNSEKPALCRPPWEQVSPHCSHLTPKEGQKHQSKQNYFRAGGLWVLSS